VRTAVALASLLALASAAACAPTLTGAACLGDCNCPSGQRCARNPDGGNGLCVVGANYCNKDAGPALFGTLTLNGGVQKPPGNPASVLAWDHNPGPLPDGGFEPPLFYVPVNTDGTWEIDPGVSGTTYYLSGVYLLNAGRGVESLPAPHTASGLAADVDVPTYSCLTWSVLASAGGTPFLAGLVADVPDITDGTEISGASVKASDGMRDFTLLFTPHPDDPFASGKFAWAPTIPGDTKAIAGTYTFTISATGYGNNTKCSVNNTLLGNVPTAPVVPNPWITIQPQTVTFYPPREAQATYFIVLDAVGNQQNLAQMNFVYHATTGAQVSVVFPAGTLGNVCPATGQQCTFNLLSLRTTLTGNTGICEATASSSSAFSTTN
jgi:hypothetical protein